jgi:hypothetical protein
VILLIGRDVQTDRLFPPPFPWEHSECAWDIYVRCGISDKLMLLTVIAAESTISTADFVVQPSRYAVQPPSRIQKNVWHTVGLEARTSHPGDGTKIIK